MGRAVGRRGHRGRTPQTLFHRQGYQGSSEEGVRDSVLTDSKRYGLTAHAAAAGTECSGIRTDQDIAAAAAQSGGDTPPTGLIRVAPGVSAPPGPGVLRHLPEDQEPGHGRGHLCRR